MTVAHHRSALRFATRTTRGWRRAALPLAAGVLGLRLGLSVSRQALTEGPLAARRHRSSDGAAPEPPPTGADPA
jgi:hypothetical protein